MNDKELDDPYCRYLANQAECVVLNVEYGKAPEYPFPKAIEQGYEIIQWMKGRAEELGIDAEKVMVGGQSSGANIAAALCLYLEEKGDESRCCKCSRAQCWISSHLTRRNRNRAGGVRSLRE